MAFAPIRRTRFNQPSGDGIDWANPITSGLLDAWIPANMAASSVLGRKPVSSGSIGLTKGKYGIGAYGISNSIRYDVGKFGESGTFCFVAIMQFLRYTSTCSVVRRDGAFSPVQVANSTVRAVGWSPVATFDEYYTVPSGERLAVLIANRVSQSTENLYVNGSLTKTNTSFSGYGTTSNPLCFLGTESNLEMFTSADGAFFGGIAFNRALSDAEVKAISANPWQVFL